MSKNKRKRGHHPDELAFKIGIVLSIGLTILAVMAVLWTSPVRQHPEALPATGGGIVVTTRQHTPTRQAPPLMDITWQLISINGTNLAEDRVERLPDLGFRGDSLVTTTALYVLTANYTVDGATLEITSMSLAGRSMASLEPESMTQIYFDALAQVYQYDLQDNQLILTYGDGQELVFVPQIDNEAG